MNLQEPVERGLVDIVRLQLGEVPPEQDFIMIEATANGAVETIRHECGVIHRVRPEYLAYEIACFIRVLEKQGIAKLYVCCPSDRAG